MNSLASWTDRLEAARSAARAGATIEQLATLSPAPVRAEVAITSVASFRASAGFEKLRGAADAFVVKTGRRPRVFLAKMGPIAQHKARADFSAAFFTPGGFEILAKKTFDSASAAAEAAAASGAHVAVLCSTDETYPDLVPIFAATVKKAQPSLHVVVAGLPAEPVIAESFRAAGVDEFIHVRANVHSVLTRILQQIGVLA
jgi:methylmalonyl-CoA mutase